MRLKKQTLILMIIMCFMSFTTAYAESVCMYAEDGRTAWFDESEVEAQKTVGWYTEPVQRLYAEGKSKVFKQSEVSAQLTVGWYTEPVQRLYAEGKSKLFKKSEVSAQLTVGWYTEPVQRLYAEGKSKLFKKSQVSAQLTVGWYTEPVQRLYAEGKSKLFKKSQVSAQLTVGWYTEPVQRLYAEGKSKLFKKSEVSAQLKVGWYTEPVQRLYAEGKNKLFKKSEVSAQLKVGWYTEPVQRLYTLDGRSKLFKKSEVSAQLKVGWYTTPQNTYKKAYAQVLRNILAYETVEAGASFSLAYIDGDNIPELIYHTTDMYHVASAKIYTYYDGKAVKLTQSGGWDEFGEWGDILYQVKGNRFASQHWGQGAESIVIFSIQNGKAVQLVSLSGSEWQWEFWVNDIEVSYSEYLAARKKYELTGGYYSSYGYNFGRDKNDYSLSETNIKAVFG